MEILTNTTLPPNLSIVHLPPRRAHHIFYTPPADLAPERRNLHTSRV